MKNTKLRRAGLVSGTAAIALAAGTALAAAPANAASAPTDVWDKVAQCESGGNWSINTGNGYHGGLQFNQGTWAAHGGQGSAANASKAQQKAVAKRVLKSQGPGAWPVCSQKAGLTRANGGSASAAPAKQAPQQQAPVQKKTNTYSQPKVQRTARQAPVQQAPQHQAPAKQAPVQQAPAQQAPQQQAPAKQAPKHAAPAPSVDKNAKGSGKFVTVKSGDTLGKIAEANGVSSWQALYSVNADNLDNPDLIFAGEKLELPAK